MPSLDVCQRCRFVMAQRSLTGDDAASTAGDAAVGATVGVGVSFAATTAGATRVIVVMLSLYDDMHHDLPVFIAPESGPDLDDMWDRAFSIDHGKLLFEPAKPIQLQFFLLTSIGHNWPKIPAGFLYFCMGKVSWTFPLIVYCIQIISWGKCLI